MYFQILASVKKNLPISEMSAIHIAYRKGTAMKLAIALIALVSANCYADMYRCPSPNGTVYHEQPCAKGGSKIEVESARPATSQVQTDPDKLAKDKAYIDDRVKARVYDREKSESLSRIQACEMEAANLLARADEVSRGYQQGTPVTMRDAANLQLDAQRRQNEILTLQGQSSARRSQCDSMRREHDQRFQK